MRECVANDRPNVNVPRRSSSRSTIWRIGIREKERKPRRLERAIIDIVFYAPVLARTLCDSRVPARQSGPVPGAVNEKLRL